MLCYKREKHFFANKIMAVNRFLLVVMDDKSWYVYIGDSIPMIPPSHATPAQECRHQTQEEVGRANHSTQRRC